MSRVGVVGDHHPWTVLRASGSEIARVHSEEGTAALTYLEPESGERMRGVLEAALQGQLAEFDLVVLDRPHARLYLYLVELRGRGLLPDTPPFHLVDAIPSTSDAVGVHNLRAVDELIAALQRRTGRRIDAGSLEEAAEAENARREAGRGIVAEREGGSLPGAVGFRRLVALTDLGAAAQGGALDVPTPTARVVLVPSRSTPSPVLHDVLARHGVDVVAEDDYHGSRGVGPALVPTRRGLADDLSHGRTDVAYPWDVRLRWYEQALERLAPDAVVIAVDPGDRAFGWEVPARVALAEQAGVPAHVVRAPVDGPLDPRAREAMTAVAVQLCGAPT